MDPQTIFWSKLVIVLIAYIIIIVLILGITSEWKFDQDKELIVISLIIGPLIGGGLIYGKQTHSS